MTWLKRPWSDALTLKILVTIELTISINLWCRWSQRNWGEETRSCMQRRFQNLNFLSSISKAFIIKYFKDMNLYLLSNFSSFLYLIYTPRRNYWVVGIYSPFEVVVWITYILSVLDDTLWEYILDMLLLLSKILSSDKLDILKFLPLLIGWKDLRRSWIFFNAWRPHILMKFK